MNPQTWWQWLKHYRANALLLIVLSAVMLGSSRLGLWRTVEWLASDQLFQLRDEPETDDRIVVVTIDEDDIQYVEQWPMPDRDLATILKNIKAQEPRAIALDLYRDLAVEPGHDELIEVFQTTPNLVGVTKVAGNVIDPAPVLAERNQIAANDFFPDADGKIRLGTVLLPDADGGQITSLSINLALTYLSAENIELELESESDNIYRLGQAKFVPLSDRDGEYRAADLGNAYLIPLNYRGGLEKFPHISMTAVLENQIPADLFQDKLVMLGPTAPSLNDVHQTPYSNKLFAITEYMPGIVIHANVTSQILASALDGRPMLRLTAKPVSYAVITISVILSHCFGVIYVRSRAISIAGTAGLLGIVAVSSYAFFVNGWIIPIATPIAAIVLTWAVTVITTLWLNLKDAFYRLKVQHHKLEQTYGQLSETTNAYSRFVPFDYLDFLRKNRIIDVELGDHVDKQMTILFSDIRSFTSIAEGMTPDQNFQFINDYLQRVSPEIREHRGLIIKFMGDGVMAVFPESSDDAVTSAIAQLHELKSFNQNIVAKGLTPIRIGLGIHTGRVMMGIVGEEFRMQGDILSDTVNLTSRLESLTKIYGISLLISEMVLDGLESPERYKIRFLDRIIVKGKSKPISIYEVFDNDEPEAIAQKEVTFEQYNQAITLYAEGKFTQARSVFNILSRMSPLDTLPKIYLDRLAYLENNNIDDWDGVWKFDEKF